MRLEEYFPMAVGRCWRYRFRFMGQDAGSVCQEVVASRRNKRSSVWRMMRHVTGTEPEPVPVIVSPEAIRVGGAEVLRGPLEVGTRWSAPGKDGPLAYEIVRVGFTAEVPAGRYDRCVEVVASRGGVKLQRTVFAPGAGMIRHRAAVPGGEMELELEEIVDPE